MTGQHRKGMAGTQTGYKKDRCRCARCRAWNAATRNREREFRRKRESADVSLTLDLSRHVLTEIEPSKGNPEPVSKAARVALEDMAAIRRNLARDPEWSDTLAETVSGETAELVRLIDAHNARGRRPLLAYGYRNGQLWVSAVEQPSQTTAVETPRMPVQPSNAELAARPATVEQLPQSAPLARPRVVPMSNPQTGDHGQDYQSPTWG